jgi:predicted membrane-bound spermidine synthase
MLGSHGIALAVMLPATIVAGMTLPLFTHVMMRTGSGEAAIGRIYAANTVGAIAGVLFAMHVGLPLLGLKNTIGVGALLDAGVGAALVLAVPRENRRSVLTLNALPALIVVVAFLATIDIPKLLLSSGVYRTGLLEPPVKTEVIYYRDGKTATIAVLNSDQAGVRSITTNGKPDAAISNNPRLPPALDERTMVMQAAFALAYKPELRTAAAIGLGSGLTVHALLADPALERLETVEIEPAVIEGARLFGERVQRTFTDPRSHIFIEDAKAFFSQRHRQYDVIVSEPSNPWVSGVSNLFSKEFYSRIRNYITDDGLLIQWIHFYEFNDDLVISILKALDANFADYVVYNLGNGDGIIVARKTGTLAEPNWDGIWVGAMGVEMKGTGYRGPAEIMAGQVGTRATLAPLLARNEAPANSDYYPYVDLNAVRARFKGETSSFGNTKRPAS